AFRILGEGQLSLTKFLLITDAAIDLRNFRMVLEHVLARADFRSDLYIFGHLSMDTLDYTGPTVNLGSKGVLLGVGDALRDLPREFTGDPPPGVKNVQVFCGGCLVVDGPSYNSSADFGTLLAQIESLATWPLVVLVDDVSATCLSTESFLWTTFTRFEPAADIKSQQQRVEKNHVMHYRPIVIDARMKPWYPDEVTCYPDVAKKASARWREYFPEGF
ncbi:MAG: UbiD family decarboxylase, partial [Bdellovibrionales bacterium]|nr:UbiD family decarboxylase [Bdellovibrionales bacterium]